MQTELLAVDLCGMDSVSVIVISPHDDFTSLTDGKFQNALSVHEKSPKWSMCSVRSPSTHALSVAPAPLGSPSLYLIFMASGDNRNQD